VGFFHCTGPLQPDNHAAMKLIPALATLCALVLTCALSAETFEGKVSMKITSASKEGSQTLDMSMKEGFMRTDMSSQRGMAAAIIDYKNQQMIILMGQQKMYMVRPLPTPGTAPRPQAPQPAVSDVTDTGVKETILGYTCTKWVHTSAQGTSEIWVTDQLGTFGGLPHGGGPGSSQQTPQAWEAALKGKNFFPLRVVTSNGGKEKFRLEVTSVEKTSLPDSLFAPPDGWRKFDLGAMMGGAMPGGFPGARPSDGNN
jgi:hypothetical protein